MNVKEIRCHGEALAVIVTARFNSPGTTFFTKASEDQQFAYIQRKKGEEVAPHTHRQQLRTVTRTQEVLVVRKGKAELTVFDHKRMKVAVEILQAGDAVVLLDGGHGLRYLEDSELFECKIGPYLGPTDKVAYDIGDFEIRHNG